MESSRVFSQDKLLIKLAFNEFKPLINTIYPNKPVYSLNELFDWYNEHLPALFYKTAKAYNINVKIKFDMQQKQALIYDENWGRCLVKMGVNNRTKLKQLNHQQFKLEDGFIFVKEDQNA